MVQVHVPSGVEVRVLSWAPQQLAKNLVILWITRFFVLRRSTGGQRIQALSSQGVTHSNVFNSCIHINITFGDEAVRGIEILRM